MLQLRGDYVVWIGFCWDFLGEFLCWDNGELLIFIQWISNEFNNLFGDEDCVEMYRYSGGWLDMICIGMFV